MGENCDLYFHQFFKTLLGFCYEGTFGDKIIYTTSLEILLQHIANHPTKMNLKIVICEIPTMMLLGEEPTQSLRQFFLNSKDDEDKSIKLFDFASKNSTDLPVFYSESSIVINHYLNDEDFRHHEA